VSAQRQFQSDFSLMQRNFGKMQKDQQQMLSVLDEVVTQIGDLKSSQIALETKVNDNIGGLRRDIQSLEKRLVARIEAHENTPIDRAHPRFYPNM
jgi:phage host-nuclease inhibitor protein Gam